MQTAKRQAGQKWWVVQQHDVFNVVEAADRPSLEVNDGERLKTVYGPFKAREDAQKRADDTYYRTLKAMREREWM